MAAGERPRRSRAPIVDDNVDAADTLALLLETLNCDTRTVYDGESALREAATFHPDLVLLDLGMPGLDGATVCARLRQESWGSNVVIAAVTGWGQDEDRRRTKISGFDHHLVKPVDPSAHHADPRTARTACDVVGRFSPTPSAGIGCLHHSQSSATSTIAQELMLPSFADSSAVRIATTLLK